MTSLKNKKTIIATHYLLYGAAQAYLDYLKKAKSDILYIALPLVTQRKSFFVTYRNGKQTNEYIFDRGNFSSIIDYFIDFFLTIWFIVFKNRESWYEFIGVDGLNCLAGLFLRMIGKVDKVIFYSIDFVPIRFKNKLLNIIYHNIEIFCVKYADNCWNVSPRIAEGRETFLHLSEKKYIQKVVPIGVWTSDIKKRSFNEVKKHQVLFVGHLLEKQGVQLVLEAVPSIVNEISDFHFIIVGGGEYIEQLKKIVKDLNIEKHVTFKGWITERKKIDDMMSESAIAIAPYKPEKEKLYNFTYYADPTKLKDYLAAGLPIILTDISYNAKEIAEKKCGILVEYTKSDIAKAILDLLQDETLLKEYRKNALAYAQSFDWEAIFDKIE